MLMLLLLQIFLRVQINLGIKVIAIKGRKSNTSANLVGVGGLITFPRHFS